MRARFKEDDGVVRFRVYVLDPERVEFSFEGRLVGGGEFEFVGCEISNPRERQRFVDWLKIQYRLHKCRKKERLYEQG